VRYLLVLAPMFLLAGCSVGSSASAPTPTPAPAPTATAPAESGARFKGPPPMTINTKHRYDAIVTTSDGTFTIQLLVHVAPITVNNFVFLARHHYYDGNPFHRIIQNFMVQTGDPTGTGFGGPGYTIKDEKVTLPYKPGVVAMANTGRPNTGGSQFFIVTGSGASSLTPSYTIFGRISKGMSVVRKIASTPVTTSPSGELSQPLKPVKIKSVHIHESG
jgi:cyclophilin family peptidyl-prolyl cis-trans isomerase